MITFNEIPAALEGLKTEVREIKQLLAEKSAPNPLRRTPIGVNQAAEFINKSKPTIYRHVHNREIPFHKQGGKLYFYEEELDRWIRNGRNL